MGAVTKLEFKNRLKDGDDGGDIVRSESITIKSVSNGWVITTSFEDGEEVTEVFDTDGNDNGNLQTIRCIIESMGLENEIKLK